MQPSSRRTAPRLLSLPAALLGCCVLTTAAVPALAQETTASSTVATHFYDLPASPLAQTLEAIAAASGRKVAYDAAAVEALRAAPVKGNLSAGAAVAQALAGTGMTLNEDGSGTLAVVAPAVVITATRDQAETSFKADRSDTSTRSGSSLHDVPASVTIITSKVIESQQLTSVQDALRNVSGIRLTQSPQSVPTFAVRGFGTVVTSGGVEDRSAASTNVFGVERVEVLKGPQAILAGSNALGGGVNVVLKKPQADDIRDVTVQFGSGADKTAAGDLSGAISEDKKLTYRLIGAKTQADKNDAGFNGRREDFILPELRWKDNKTDLIVGLSYGTQFAPSYGATFARRDGVILPQPQRLGSPYDGIGSLQKKAFYQLEQVLAPGLTLVSRLQRTLDSTDLHNYSPAGLSYAKGALPSSPSANMSFYSSRTLTDNATTAGDHYLRAVFKTWGIRHKLSAGVNQSTYSYVQSSWSGATQTRVPYGAAELALPDVRTIAVTPSATSYYRQKQQAVYVQELLSVGDWDFLLNARRTLYKLSPGVTNYTSINYVYRQDGRTMDSNTPGAGVVYKLRPEVSVYASYAEGFVPQNTLQCGGAGLVPPIESRNKEGGFKFDLLDSRLMLTTSVFSLAQANQLQYDATHNCYNVRDSQQTRGGELDLQGRLAKGWDIIANYSYSTIKDVGDAKVVYPGIPRHKASFWSTYSFQNAALKGWGAGLGVTASAHAVGTYDTTYPYTLPGQAQIDANVFWQRPGWNVTLGVKNLADRVLYGSSGSSSYVPLLPGRQFMLTVKRSFL